MKEDHWWFKISCLEKTLYIGSSFFVLINMALVILTGKLLFHWLVVLGGAALFFLILRIAILYGKKQ